MFESGNNDLELEARTIQCRNRNLKCIYNVSGADSPFTSLTVVIIGNRNVNTLGNEVFEKVPFVLNQKNNGTPSRYQVL